MVKAPLKMLFHPVEALVWLRVAQPFTMAAPLLALSAKPGGGNYPCLSNPFHQQKFPSFSWLWYGDHTSQELAFCVPFNSFLPFGYDSNLTNYFSTESMALRHLPQVLDIPNPSCYLWPLQRAFLASRLSPPAPSTISIMSSPSLLFIILN